MSKVPQINHCFCSLFEGSDEPLWRLPGKDVTIQCRYEKEDNVEALLVMRGLSEDDVFRLNSDNLDNPLIKEPFRGRLQYTGTFPNLDILIKNLMGNDTGPYWCYTQVLRKVKRRSETVKAEGSVLLVVSGKP